MGMSSKIVKREQFEDKNMNFVELCDRLFDLNEDIRYACVIDDIGTVVAGGMRKNTAPVTDQANDELYLAQTALRKSMRQKFDQNMGKARFAYVEREKLSILTFYLDKNTLVLALEPNLDSHTAMDIAEDTIEMLKNGKA